MSKIGKDIDHAAELLKSGQLIGIPTETVYGLAAHAFSEPALINVFKAKNRPYFDPLIVHVSSMERLHDIAEITDERLKALAQHFWPGPLTLLLPKKKKHTRFNYQRTATCWRPYSKPSHGFGTAQ